MLKIKNAIDALVYASVALGYLLLFATALLVPSWLFVSLTMGTSAYAVCAVAVAMGWKQAYYAVIGLAILVLLVSLPQPSHYAFASGGEVGDFLIFAAGSVMQVLLLVLIPIYLWRVRR